MPPSNELQELWTRLVSGTALSSAEADELATFLRDADAHEVQWMHKDLAVDDGLRAIQGIRSAKEISEDQTAEFLDRVLQRLPPNSIIDSTESTTPARVAPPPRVVQPPPMVESVTKANPVHVSDHQERAAKRTGLPKWVTLAVAASLLAVVGLTVWISSGDGKTENAIADNASVPKSNPKPIPPTSNLPIGESDAPQVIDQNLVPILADSSPQKTEPGARPPENKTDTLANGDNLNRNTPIQSPEKIPERVPDQPPVLDRPESPSMNSNTRLIATVLPSPDAVWPDGFDPTAAGMVGPIELLSGTARLRLEKGTELTLQGATKISVVDGNHITLADGVVSATVPKRAVGFEVDAPGGRIIDLGTKFTVQCLPDQGYTLVTVSEGKVDTIQPPIKPRGRPRKSRLTAGRTKWLPTDSGKAYDWVLNVQFGGRQPSEVTIDGKSLDLSQPRSKTNATMLVNAALESAREQMRLVTRGERFSGLVIVNDASESVVNKRQLASAGSFISEQIQVRGNTGPKLLSPAEMMQEFQSRMKQMLGTP